MRTHIKVVAIVNIFYSVLGILGALGALFSGMFGGLMTHGIVGLLVGTIGGIVAALVIGAISIFGLIAGFALLSHQGWARNVMIVVSVLRLFRWPMGTLFGGYSLWVLMNDETRHIFESQL